MAACVSRISFYWRRAALPRRVSVSCTAEGISCLFTQGPSVSFPSRPPQCVKESSLRYTPPSQLSGSSQRQSCMGSPGGSGIKNPGEAVPSLGGKDPREEETATPLQHSCLENPVDRGAWRATIRGVTKELNTTE